MAPKAEGDAQMVLAGGQSLCHPFGTFLAPNISPDPTHGIGGWTLDQFVHAVQDGISPAGQHYFPAMPYVAYAKMAPQDVVDLKAFMDTLPADADVPNQPHEVGFPVQHPPQPWAAGNSCSRQRLGCCATTPTPEVAARSLYCRGAGPLRRMPHAAQPAGWADPVGMAGRCALAGWPGQGAQHHAGQADLVGR